MSNSISKYFTGIGAKRLSEVEVDPATSNQHEFNGIKEFKEIFGYSKTKYAATFILLSDEEEKTMSASGSLTWYDAREKHETRTEFRYYYTGNEVINKASVGDLLIIGRTGKEKVAVIIAPAGSIIEEQLLWLFGLSEVNDKFIAKDFKGNNQNLSFAARYILSALGIEADEEPTEDYLNLIQRKFGIKFPTTNDFSEFARSLVKDVSPVDNPDETLLAWMEKEEMLFKIFERYIVEEKLKRGFGENGSDVDDFIKFSLSVQNRRKSRAGFAFENHLSLIWEANKIRYSKGKVTELNKKPDFIFPGITEYHNDTFNVSLLTMLGVKTSVKDRWRQILSEAAKIKSKHLITLEPAISKNQTDEMISENVQLVIPKGILETYTNMQRERIITLSEFIKTVAVKQNNFQK